MEPKKNIERNRKLRELLLSGVSFTEAVAQTGISKSSAYFHLDQMRKRGEWDKPKKPVGPGKKCRTCGVKTKNRTFCVLHACDNPSRPLDPNRKLAEIWDLAGYQRSARIRQNARKIYMRSDSPKCCKKCGYDKSFDVCHIAAIASYGPETTIGEVNNIENLVALCKTCHWEFDHGSLSLREFLEKG